MYDSIIKTCVIFFVSLCFVMSPMAHGKVIYVDDDGPADFDSIQAGIDAASDGDVVLVVPGVYTGDGNRDIDFEGKAITVKRDQGPEACIIDCGGSATEPHRGFSFRAAEEGESVLEGFTIANGYVAGPGGGVHCDGGRLRIVNCRIRGNVAYSGGGFACSNSIVVIASCLVSGNVARDSGGGIYVTGPRSTLANCLLSGNTAKSGGGISCAGDFSLTNCTVANNRTGMYGNGGGVQFWGRRGKRGILRNCIVWGNTASHCQQIAQGGFGILGLMDLALICCVVQDGPDTICPLKPIEGNWVSVEPHFAKPGHWSQNGMHNLFFDDVWIDGDYHLKSQAGHWDPVSGSWIRDEVTSPCIDAGDPVSPIGQEPFPNGGRVNMGAYGGTAEASKSYFGEPVCETVIAGDINGDCRVDFRDLQVMAGHWLEERGD